VCWCGNTHGFINAKGKCAHFLFPVNGVALEDFGHLAESVLQELNCGIESLGWKGRLNLAENIVVRGHLELRKSRRRSK
jgi:hypothetical protein